MAEITDAELEAAAEAGRVEFETMPHAARAQYDRRTGLVTLHLYNDCVFSFPARQLQGLADATDDDLAEVELSPFGYGVHWEKLDADFTVPGLLAGRFGTARFMSVYRERLRTLYERLLHRPDAQAAE